MTPHSDMPILEPLRIGAKATDDVTQMDVVNAADALPKAMMIGDLKLTALKVRLNQLNISAEFAGEGVLVCRVKNDEEEDVVAVRKTRRGEVRVEGCASNLFYIVREEIYQLHALVETESIG